MKGIGFGEEGGGVRGNLVVQFIEKKKKRWGIRKSEMLIISYSIYLVRFPHTFPYLWFPVRVRVTIHDPNQA